MMTRRFETLVGVCTVLGLVALSTGCASRQQIYPASTPLPAELKKVTMPEYVIEPPDILLIDALQLVPLPPYHVQPLDVLALQVQNTIPESPIAGRISLGAAAS